MTETEILRAELERLFELDELLQFSREVLGFEPDVVGGITAKASFAGALTVHCVENDAVEALCDALLATRPGVAAEVDGIRAAGLVLEEELPAGSSLGPYSELTKLANGRLGISYIGRRGAVEHRLKVLSREAQRDRRGLQRFLTVTRLVSRVEHRGLPRDLHVGNAEGRVYVAHEHVPGVPLAKRAARGPQAMAELRELLYSILEALSALHQRRIAHGDLRLENIIVPEANGEARAVLVDIGSDRLRMRPRLENGRTELFSTTSSPRTASPEQIRGLPADARSDVYSFGAILYELVTGTPPFSDKNALDAAFGHLSQTPVPPLRLAPPGFVSAQLEALILRTLEKEPSSRPADATALLELFDQLNTPLVVDSPPLPAEELTELVKRTLDDPEGEEALRTLESRAAGNESSSAAARELIEHAHAIGADTAKADTKKRLLVTAARLLASRVETRESAAETYGELVESWPEDEAFATALIELYRKLGRHDEMLELLIERSERAATRPAKAHAFAEIGRVYREELSDPDQALVAFTQALTEDPEESGHAAEVERLAGSKIESWGEVLSSCAAAADDTELPAPERVVLWTRAARWWLERAQRQDLAIDAYNRALALDPNWDPALEGLAQIYRKLGQWPELGFVLTRRAEIAKAPALARDMRVEAAEILDVHLNDQNNARILYEQVVGEDPGHAKAAFALSKLYERLGDHAALVRLLEASAAAQRPDERVKTLCRVADVYATVLHDDGEAERRYAAALEQDPTSADALRGLERCYEKTGRYNELLANLERQVELAATPRQKVTLLERIAGLYGSEFLDHDRAAESLVRLLALDPEHEPSLSALVRHYRALERWDDVIRLYDRQLKLPADAGQKLSVLLEKARLTTERVADPEAAIAAYEAVIALAPGHPEALEALARLRESAGDADAALGAVEALARKAPSPEARAEQWVRAAKLVAARGDMDGAIERYQRALDESPRDAAAAAGLREAFAARGDVHAAMQLFERELEQTDGPLAKAKLLGRMAVLYREQLRDDLRADGAAKRALGLDPTNLEALATLGELAFESQRYLEANKYYESIVGRIDALPKEHATRLLLRHAEALTASGAPDKAVAPMEALLRIASDDLELADRAATAIFEHGSPERAAEVYGDLAQRSAREPPARRAALLYRHGEALRRGGKLEEAIAALEEAADLDPATAAPLVALARTREAQQAWPEVIKVKTRHLESADGDERLQLLLEIAEIWSNRLADRTQATKTLVAALEERPDDRRLLTRLMQLYSEEKDWNKLVEVVLRLADFVEDPKQRVKYLHTAAIVTARQIGDSERALEFYDQVLALEPDFERALAESIELSRKRGDHAAAEEKLRRKLALATAAENTTAMVETFDQLGELYEKSLGWAEQAVDAYEAAQTLDPENTARRELLTRLYTSDPERYLDKAVQSEFEVLRADPFNVESYRRLRRLYTETKRADEAWCLCQALSVLDRAEPDEERFYRRMRSETAAPAETALSDEDWLQLVMHPDADPLLTSIFALIEPAVIARRTQTLEELGYDASWLVNLAEHPAPVCQSLYYAAGVLGIEPPPTYENPNDAGGVSFLFARDPSLVLGLTALRPDVPLQLAAFIAAHKLAYLRPGMYVRHLLASGTALKAWLFAAIKLTSPQFPVAPEIEGAVQEAVSALEVSLAGQARDQLTRVVAKVLTSGAALDLKRWVAAVDLTADRAGFIIAHDLAISVQVVRLSEEGTSALPAEERVKELVLFSVSPEYYAVRRRLSITVDS